MHLTPYHAKYFAYELTKRCSSDSMEKLAGALVDAQVDLNPHQIEAALFAFRSPFSKGAILADEVGLGKTIEAGLVISQKWAERKRRVLVIVPSNLRKQWHQELTEKFFLPCRILETKSYNHTIKQGNFRPFQASDIVICSYQFARSKASDINGTPWDLVVIDEAHRLRNVYKPSNVIANTIKQALKDSPKLLLTATPLQNSLLELFGLVSCIDDRTFGDLKSFREQFAYLNSQAVFNTLKARLQPLCHRTLRRQVLPYVRYTKRLPIVQPFTPEESEDRLYSLVSEYLRRDNLQALPASQRTLMTLVLRKLLASSTFAISGALESLIRRLEARLKKATQEQSLAEELDEDYEALDETAEEWPEEEVAESLTAEDRAAIEREIADLRELRQLAVSITHNAKGKALLVALDRAFKEADRLGAARKALVFTESRRTQDYLLRALSDSPYKNGVVLFNGSNNDEKSRSLYREWVERHAGTDRVTGSRTADMRSALVDYFKEQGAIMIATEAGAEGINLQFSSLVVNYDLPWNPQRIEQRIGRCHRYGQQHDVVVVNFLNQKNAADQRVFQLLAEKFQLFEGVFGASDEVLGAIESGVDFERRIAGIYQRCRTPEEINASFDALQSDLSAQIDEAMTRTRQQLLENFDDEVREKLRVSDESSRQYLDYFERMLMRLTRHELNGNAPKDVNESARAALLRSSEHPERVFRSERESNEDYYFLGGEQLIFYKSKTKPIDGRISTVSPLTNLWDDILSNNLHNEGGVTFPNGKKPEALIKRCLELSTQRGDRVLDSFAGSGTTGAVAQKMGRRWIMVELGEHCHTHIIPRLKRVVDGIDQSGISKSVNWKGGGGFRYYRLAPSLLQQDKWGNWVINKEYKPEMLAEAVCKLEGFIYAPSDAVYWQHGHSTERDFIYVTTQNLSHDQLQQLSDEVGPARTLLVMCTAFRGKPDRYSNLTIKKIPKAVLSRCEWGKDDYSLQVENLPKAPPPRGRMELIPADGDELEPVEIDATSSRTQGAHD